MNTVTENLIAAKALIETPEKWVKGDYEPRPGCYCAAGALAAAKGVAAHSAAAEKCPEVDALENALNEISDGLSPWVSFIHFNDDPGTTHADIMALFDSAIAAQDGAP